MRKTIGGIHVKSVTEGRVTAVISTFGVKDLDGDVVLPGAIRNGASVVVSAYGHTSWEGRLPVGKGVLRTTSTEAILEAQFFLDTTAGLDTFNVVKALAEDGLGEWSYSLSDVKSHRGQLKGEPVNFLESIHVTEASPVLVGASIGTRTLSAKSATSTPADIRDIYTQHRIRTGMQELADRYPHFF